MTPLQGYLFDGHTSKRHTATLTVDAGGQVRIESTALGVSGCPWSALTISPRIGTSARYLDLPNGLRFETTDNDAIDRLSLRWGGDRRQGWIHHLESRLHAVAIALLAVGVFLWWGMQYGLPTLARQVAFSLPVSVNQQISQHTLETLDQYVFSVSTLNAAQTAAIQQHFTALTRQSDSPFTYRLHLRDGASIGANAFALPAGDIIITDQLVTLAANMAELDAVIAHELGHIEQRHGLRSVLQSSALPLLIIAVTGDMATASSILAALPTLLLESHYSRGFELEADQFAKRLLLQQGKDPAHLAAILERLATQASDQPPSWLASHPATQERIQQLLPPAHD